MVKARGQVLGLVVQCLELGFSLQFTYANKKLLTACQPWSHYNTCPWMWNWAVTDVTV